MQTTRERMPTTRRPPSGLAPTQLDAVAEMAAFLKSLHLPASWTRTRVTGSVASLAVLATAACGPPIDRPADNVPGKSPSSTSQPTNTPPTTRPTSSPTSSPPSRPTSTTKQVDDLDHPTHVPGIPNSALKAYVAAADKYGEGKIHWYDIAGIMKVLTDHGRLNEPWVKGPKDNSKGLVTRSSGAAGPASFGTKGAATDNLDKYKDAAGLSSRYQVYEMKYAARLVAVYEVDYWNRSGKKGNAARKEAIERYWSSDAASGAGFYNDVNGFSSKYYREATYAQKTVSVDQPTSKPTKSATTKPTSEPTKTSTTGPGASDGNFPVRANLKNANGDVVGTIDLSPIESQFWNCTLKVASSVEGGSIKVDWRAGRNPGLIKNFSGTEWRAQRSTENGEFVVNVVKGGETLTTPTVVMNLNKTTMGLQVKGSSAAAEAPCHSLALPGG